MKKNGSERCHIHAQVHIHTACSSVTLVVSAPNRGVVEIGSIVVNVSRAVSPFIVAAIAFSTVALALSPFVIAGVVCCGVRGDLPFPFP